MNGAEWSENDIRKAYESSADVQRLTRSLGEIGEVVLIYCEGMSDAKELSKVVFPALDVLATMERGVSVKETLDAFFETQEVKSQEQFDNRLFNGGLILWFTEQSVILSHNMEDIPKRQPSESVTEISLKGPRDGFTEELSTNVALIRKRLQTSQLHNETFTIGEQTRTLVSLLYLDHIAKPELVQEARNRLNRVRLNALLSSAQLEDELGDSRYSLFPLIDYIGRPDFASQSLLRGRLLILVNGSPMVLIAPSNLTAQLKSPEDLHLPYYFVAFERVLRMIGLFIAIFMPGFWIALSSFNMDQIPFQLLATITNSRTGLPFSSAMEAILMLGLFELFREAGIRLPKAVGQTIAVVGGLIVGDAAIRAGLTSPTLLVVSAVTAVATFTLVNQTLSGCVSVLRIFVLVCSSILGMYGFFMGMFCIVAYMASLSSFGLGYLEPVAPVSFKGLLKGLLAVPRGWFQRKPKMLADTNPNKKE